MVVEIPEKYEDLKNGYVSLAYRVAQLEELLRLDRKRRFGPSSESINHTGMEPLFSDLMETENSHPEEKPSKVKGHERKIVRKKIPDSLPREEIYCDLTPEEKICPDCQQEMKKISEKFSEKLHVQPAIFIVKKFITPAFCCNACEGIKQAKMPFHPIPKCQVSQETLAYVAVSKFADGLPLNRVENIFARNDIDIKRDRLSGWLIKYSEVLKPVAKEMHERILAEKVFGIDETTFQVLKEKGRHAHQKSYMLVQAREGPPGKHLIVFHYEKSRSSGVIGEHLKDFSGHIISDGLGVYDSLFANRPEIVHGGCWSHARRKFMDAAKVKKKQISTAVKMVELINQLFAVEKRIKEDCLDIKTTRLEESAKVLDDIDTLLKAKILCIPKKSLTGNALHYLKNQWQKLSIFLSHPELPIHNNFVERCIRPVAVGRKAFLFADTVEGANAAAIFYSLISTAKLNKINPYQYLCEAIDELGKGTSPEKLLPIK